MNCVLHLTTDKQVETVFKVIPGDGQWHIFFGLWQQFVTVFYLWPRRAVYILTIELDSF